MSNFILRIDCKLWIRITVLAVMLGLWASAAMAAEPAAAPKGAPNATQVGDKRGGDALKPVSAPSQTAPQSGPEAAGTLGSQVCKQDCYSRQDLLIMYVAILALLILGLHLADSIQTHWASRKIQSEFMKKLPDKLGSEQCGKVAGDLVRLNESMTGIPGTTRSIVTYALLAILGIAIFHLLVVSNDATSADKYLSLLAGSVTSIVGFYYGSKAAEEGAKSAKKPDEPASPKNLAARIDKVDPPEAKPGDPVTIHGEGFGAQAGAVQFGSSGSSLLAEVKDGDWTDRYIKVKVPEQASPGEAPISVNPPFSKIVVVNGFKVLPADGKAV